MNNFKEHEAVDLKDNYLEFKELKSSLDLIKNKTTVIALFDMIFQWGLDRGITLANGATFEGQVDKTIEEAVEAKEAYQVGDRKKLVDGIGDQLVTLVMQARLAGVSFDEALIAAWQDIRDRRGQMCCGIFVKQSDIDVLGDHGFELSQFKSSHELQDMRRELKL